MSNKVIIGDATLYHGDCLEILPTLDKVDAVVTDPPYGIGYKHSGKAGGKWNVVNSARIVGDGESFNPTPFLHMECVMFGGDHFANTLPTGGIFHYWDKECGRTNRFDSFSDAEVVWTSKPCKRQVMRYMWKGLQVEEPHKDNGRRHPTQKPVAVMEWAVGLTAGAMILDPYMGSGTTGVACANLGRKFIGIEIEKKYFDIACERIDAAYSQGRLFA
jgi:site-specific DNA-methyltransferase (adenine-specific)/modification methylase